jgi:hypothetical protein
MSGFNSKRKAAADKLQEPLIDRLRKTASKGVSVWGDLMLEAADALAQPAQEPEMLTIAYQSGYHDGKKAALAGREWNFCERCGKRTKDLMVIHTCTPPQGDA